MHKIDVLRDLLAVCVKIISIACRLQLHGMAQLTTMRESQSRHVVHTYYALERGQFDSVIHLWLFELLGNVINFGEVDRSKILVFQISARPRSRRGGAEQGPVFAVVVVYHRL